MNWSVGVMEYRNRPHHSTTPILQSGEVVL
jgi:hypothetical protein